MDDTITLDEHGFRSVLAARPVTRESYRRYLHDTGQPLPHMLTQPAPPTAPITDVSQAEATAYCRWLSARRGGIAVCRPWPSWRSLNGELAEQDLGPEAWPHTQGHLQEVIGGLKPVFLCEWTAGDRDGRAAGGPTGTYPGQHLLSALAAGGQHRRTQAHLLATEGYSFVTFRVAYDA